MTYRIDPGLTTQFSAFEDGFRNGDITLKDADVLANIRKVQQRQNLPLSDALVTSPVCKFNLDVEMETGTGKTYCYIKTIFEMNRRFGWSKFIIMVPSIAIREGVAKSLEITAEHFTAAYGKKARFFIYNSKRLSRALLKTSDISGRCAEIRFIKKCSFSKRELLADEVKLSEFTNRPFGIDEMSTSSLTGRVGHKSEVIECRETGAPIGRSEGVRCEVTGAFVRPDALVVCQESGLQVIPSETFISAVSGIRARKMFFVTSSLSGALFLENESMKAINGNPCMLSEAMPCEWSNVPSHPDDLFECELTGLRFRRNYLTVENPLRHSIMLKLLEGRRHEQEFLPKWPKFEETVKRVLGNNSLKILAAVGSPDGLKVAVVFELRSYFGFRIRHGGCVIRVSDAAAIGRVRSGRRVGYSWLAD